MPFTASVVGKAATFSSISLFMNEKSMSLPSYWLDAVLFQILVSLDEMTATEESAIDREGRGVRCFEHQVFAVVDDASFLSSITTPEKED